MTTTTATFTKLRTGDWGIRLVGSLPGLGDEVPVITRAGDRKTVRVAHVVWSDGATHVCAIKADRPMPAKRAPTRRRGFDCRHQSGGFCRHCAADEI